mgnify:FL=1
MNWFVKTCAVIIVACSSLAYAGEAQPLAQDPLVETRLNAISENLRCLVCQNETLAASRSDLAEDLRREVRHLIEAGKSDKEIIEFLVSRYGDYVLYNPPFKTTTVLLWVGPFVLLAGGIIGLIVFLRRRSRQGLVDEEDAEPVLETVVVPAVDKRPTGRWLVLLMLAIIPLGGALVYLKVGNPAALDPARAKAGPDPEVMVARLAAKLEANPNDAQGWQLLARAYLVMNRPADAVKAYNRILPEIKKNPDLMGDYVEALAGSGDMAGARTWINKALQLDAKNPKIIFLAGGLAFEQGNFPEAIRYWEKALKLVEPNSKEAQFIQENIAEAKSRIK